MVSLKNLSHSFDSKELYNNLNHTFEAGIHALVGKSGKGKTTLLRMIAGLIKPDSGEISVDAPVSVSFQDSVLFPWYSAKRNIEIVSNADTAFTLLKEFGLENDANTLPAKLSGGMKNRVSIARALAFDSQTVLLDEPFAGLDYETALMSLEIIRKYTTGKTVIISTHNIEIASMLDTIFEI